MERVPEVLCSYMGKYKERFFNQDKYRKIEEGVLSFAHLKKADLILKDMNLVPDWNPLVFVYSSVSKMIFKHRASRYKKRFRSQERFRN